MKFVQIDPATNSVTWDAYFAYLECNRERFPPDLYAYAIDWENYNLSSPKSLHDSWLASVGFETSFSVHDVHDDGDVTMRFLGAFHDRYHVFHYSGVIGLNMDLRVTSEPGGRDLFVHEIRATDAGFQHEFLFSNRNRIEVEFQHVTIGQTEMPEQPEL